MTIDKNDPSQSSADHAAMLPDWQMIADIRAGSRAIKSKGKTYLPQFQEESDEAYKIRVAYTPWRPEFVDALRNLCAKPFTKKVVLNAEAPDDFVGKIVNEKTKERRGGWVDDVDGRGNSIHVFARERFEAGVSAGMTAIYVTYPDVVPARTKAEENEIGAKPYWVPIEAKNILALYTKNENGKENVSYIRYSECDTEQDGFSELVVERIRIVRMHEGFPTSQLWRKEKQTPGGQVKWIIEKPEARLEGVKTVPIALLFTGERSNNYRVIPPLIDVATMQIELYRALSRQEEILTYAGHPMLKAIGMAVPKPTKQMLNGVETLIPAPQIMVGPKTVLFAPPQMEGVQSDWQFIQPAAENIKAIQEHIDKLTENLRRLALQPLARGSGSITATEVAVEGAKAHSAVEVWATALADTLDQCLKFTAEWMKRSDTVTSVVHTDFGVDIQGTEESKLIGDMQKRRVVSRKTEREEAARRGILGPQYDEEQEEQRLAEEDQALIDENIDPATGKPFEEPTLPGDPNNPKPKPSPNGSGAIQ